MKLTHLLLVAACLLLAASSHAQVVVGTNLELNHEPFGTNNNRYFANVFWLANRHPDATWHVGIEYDGATIRGDIDPSINGNGTFYLVQPGDVLSHQTFGQYPALTHTSIPAPSGDLFLGLRMTGPPDIFGWMRLRPVGGVLTMVENVMAYNTTGIVVGTTQVVPEPSAWVILMAGAAAFVWRRTR